MSDKSELIKRLEGYVAGKGKSRQAEWSEADPNKILRAICQVVGMGGFVGFGKSSDGGAYTVWLSHDDSSITLRCPCTEPIDDLLDVVYEAFSMEGEAMEILSSLNGHSAAGKAKTPPRARK